VQDSNKNLDILLKLKEGDSRTVKEARTVHSPKMRNMIRKVIKKTGLHEKLSVNYGEIIDDIEQEAWVKLVRTLKQTTDIERNEWLANSKLSAILMKFANDEALNYTTERGKKRNLKVDKNEPKGIPRSFSSLDLEDDDNEPLLEALAKELSPEQSFNEQNIQINFSESLSTDLERRILTSLLQGKQRKDIVSALNITMYKYNTSVEAIKSKAQKLDCYALFF